MLAKYILLIKRQVGLKIIVAKAKLLELNVDLLISITKLRKHARQVSDRRYQISVAKRLWDLERYSNSC